MTAATRVNFNPCYYFSMVLEITPLVPRDPAVCVLLRQGLIHSIDVYAPGLLATEISAISAVSSRSIRTNEGRVHHFLRIGAIFTSSAMADEVVSQDRHIQLLLQAIHAKVEQLLGDACTVTSLAASGFLPQALGQGIQSLPCFVGSYSAWAHPSFWIGPASPQPALDSMLLQSGPSAIAFMLVQECGIDQSSSSYRFSIVTVGLDSGSPVFQSLGAETTGAGVLMANTAPVSNRPVMSFSPINYSNLHDQFTELRAFVAVDGQQIGVSPQLDAASAAHLLALPRMLFRP